MASVELCRKQLLADQSTAELLVHFLHETPRVGATLMELAACERVQQKAAIAVCRLSRDQDVALIFIELHCKYYISNYI